MCASSGKASSTASPVSVTRACWRCPASIGFFSSRAARIARQSKPRAAGALGRDSPAGGALGRDSPGGGGLGRDLAPPAARSAATPPPAARSAGIAPVRHRRRPGDGALGRGSPRRALAAGGGAGRDRRGRAAPPDGARASAPRARAPIAAPAGASRRHRRHRRSRPSSAPSRSIRSPSGTSGSRVATSISAKSSTSRGCRVLPRSSAHRSMRSNICRTRLALEPRRLGDQLGPLLVGGVDQLAAPGRRLQHREVAQVADQRAGQLDLVDAALDRRVGGGQRRAGVAALERRDQASGSARGRRRRGPRRPGPR